MSAKEKLTTTTLAAGAPKFAETIAGKADERARGQEEQSLFSTGRASPARTRSSSMVKLREMQTLEEKERIREAAQARLSQQLLASCTFRPRTLKELITEGNKGQVPEVRVSDGGRGCGRGTGVADRRNRGATRRRTDTGSAEALGASQDRGNESRSISAARVPTKARPRHQCSRKRGACETCALVLPLTTMRSMQQGGAVIKADADGVEEATHNDARQRMEGAQVTHQPPGGVGGLFLNGAQTNRPVTPVSRVYGNPLKVSSLSTSASLPLHLCLCLLRF
jgi:hypothetical protein